MIVEPAEEPFEVVRRSDDREQVDERLRSAAETAQENERPAAERAGNRAEVNRFPARVAESSPITGTTKGTSACLQAVHGAPAVHG